MEHPQTKVLPAHLRRAAAGQQTILRSVILTDTVVTALNHHPTLKAEFPFVRAAPRLRAKSSCNKCNKSKSRMDIADAVDINSVKEQITQLTGDRLARFKSLIGASEITLFLRTPAGVQKRTL